MKLSGLAGYPQSCAELKAKEPLGVRTRRYSVAFLIYAHPHKFMGSSAVLRLTRTFVCRRCSFEVDRCGGVLCEPNALFQEVSNFGRGVRV